MKFITLIRLLATALVVSSVSARLGTESNNMGNNENERQLDVWDGTDGQFCTPLGTATYCYDEESQNLFGCSPGTLVGACEDCLSGTWRWEGALTLCGPARDCKPAGDFVSWFGASLCCGGHYVHWYGAIECT